MKRLCIPLMLTVWMALQFSSAWAVTVSVRVNAGNDDAEELISDGSMYRNSSDLEMSYDDFQGGLQIVGMRFTGLAIPQGATINSAYIEFETDETDSGATNLVIVGEAIDDASTFGAGANDISGRTSTTASVTWSPGPWNTVNELHQTPDLSAIIQEIVDRSGWVSGNDLVITVEPGAGCVDTNCQRTAESWDGEAAAAALLVVDYTSGTGTTCTTQKIASDGEEFKGISGSSDSNVIAVGKNGSIYHYNGTIWIKNIFVSNEELGDVEVVSSILAFAVGKNGKVLQYDGVSWTTLPAPTGEDLEGVWAISSTELWVTGKKDALFLWNGASWQDMSGAGQANIDNNKDLKDAWGNSNYFYTVEKDGDLYRYTRTGGPWDKFNACNNSFNINIEDIWGDGSGNIYIAGQDKGPNPDEAIVLLYNEGTNSCSTVISSDTENKMEGIYGNGGIVYAVGKKGLILDNSSGSWSESTDGTEDLKDVWVSGSSTAYYAGKKGFITVCSTQTPTVVDHFNINVGAGSANTCNPFNFTVTAEDSSNNPVTDYTSTVSLTTSTSNGNFSTVTATNNINPNPDSDDNGSAGYTFDLLDSGSVTLAIANDHAETLTLLVSDAAVPVTSISTNISFSDNAFTIVDNDLLVAGDNVPVAGRDHSYQIQMIRKDPIVGCGVATGYTGLKPLKMWRSKNASDPSPNDPALAGSSLPAADPGVNNGSITFVNGVADVALATVDIGKFTIELADISNTFADITIAGTSAEQTVRPFGLAVTNIIAGATVNPGANTPAGGIFTSAGADFSATVSSVLWDTGDDLDNDGVLDTGIYANNTILPSYAWDTTLSVSLIGFEPATGVPGNLINGGIMLADFSAGSSTPNDLQYTEVGSFTLQASAIDYLGEATADLVGDDIIVGRFTPASLLISSTVDGMLANTCTIYTYIGESFTYDVIHPSFEISAMNGLAVPAVTQNYTGIWAKLDDTSITLTNPTSDGSQLGSDSLTLMALTYTQDAGLYNITDNADGTFKFEFANDQFMYDRDANSEISPFDSDFDLIVTDVTDLDAVTNTGIFTLQPLPVESRFGRIKMGNIHGSELIDLSMPMLVEYLNPAGLYVANTDDNCTAVTTADLAITDNLSVPGSSTVTVSNSTALAGDLGVSLTAPGAGIDGNIIVAPALTGVADWLQYDWDSIGAGLFDDDPSAIATFGIYSGNDVNIYKGQIYQ